MDYMNLWIIPEKIKKIRKVRPGTIRNPKYDFARLNSAEDDGREGLTPNDIIILSPNDILWLNSQSFPFIGPSFRARNFTGDPWKVSTSTISNQGKKEDNHKVRATPT
jgi:hypothetical protein